MLIRVKDNDQPKVFIKFWHRLFRKLLILFSIENKTPRQWTKLHRVHESALDFFEHDNSEEKQHGGDGS